MSVEIKFLPSDASGLVAQGSYIIDAARRLGVRIPAECGGRGACDTCAVTAETGATLLSSLTEAERTQLSPDRLAAGERLACQAKIESAGEIVLRLVPATERAETSEEVKTDLRREFRELPLDRKLATLVELEAVTAFQTLSSIAEVPSKVAGKLLDLFALRGRQLSEREREVRTPPEHRAEENSSK
jgi:ferredoxin